MTNSNARLTNLTMGSIDYRKAYDMVTHTWIHECLEMYKVDEKMRHMMRNSMKTWRTVLECNGRGLEEINIRRGIFQGDTLLPLVLVIAVIPLTSTPGYVFKNKTKISHQLYMDDLKLFRKKHREIWNHF